MLLRLLTPALATIGGVLLMATSVVPIRDYERIGDPITLGSLVEDGPVWLVVLPVVALVVGAWLVAVVGSRVLAVVWSVAALVVALLVAATPFVIGDSPILWDGTGPDGRPTGGMETAELAPGALLAWSAAAAFLLAAALSPFTAARRAPAPAPEHR